MTALHVNHMLVLNGRELANVDLPATTGTARGFGRRMQQNGFKTLAGAGVTRFYAAAVEVFVVRGAVFESALEQTPEALRPARLRSTRGAGDDIRLLCAPDDEVIVVL